MMDSSDFPVLCFREDGIVHVRFNRPSVLNAIDAETSARFLTICRDIELDPACRVVMLSGAGKSFMAGGDLASLRQNPREAASALIEPLNEALTILARLPQPVIGSLQGSVAGAGVGMALACDLVIAADNTKFNLAYAKVGTSLDASSSWGLPRVVGLRKAMELALLAETIDSEQAKGMGLVNKVVPLAELESAAKALAQRLAAGPTVAYGNIKRLLRNSFAHTLEAHLSAEYQAFCECTGTADFLEGLDAFFEKRPPSYQGK